MAQRNSFRKRVVVHTGSDTIVQQQFKDEVDIQTIVRRFGLGQSPVYHEGVYGDFTGITDYGSAAAAVQRANENFMRLPADARDRFDNDPGRFLEYASQVSEKELVEVLGLRLKEEPKSAPPVEAVLEPKPVVAPAPVPAAGS